MMRILEGLNYRAMFVHAVCTNSTTQVSQPLKRSQNMAFGILGQLRARHLRLAKLWHILTEAKKPNEHETLPKTTFFEFRSAKSLTISSLRLQGLLYNSACKGLNIRSLARRRQNRISIISLPRFCSWPTAHRF